MTQGVYLRTSEHLAGIRLAASKRRKHQPIQTGDVFGFWTVIKEGLFQGYNKHWICRCECGFEKGIYESHLRGKRSTKCRKCSDKEKSQRKAEESFGKYNHNRRATYVRLRVEELYETQKRICPLCGKQLPQELSKCAWDHDHLSGEGRALLHKGCNVFLGFIERDSSILDRVTEYCKKHNIKI